MGINDVGVPGEPMDSPPLTAWQQSVVAVLGGSDTPVAQRFLALTGGTLTGPLTVGGDLAAGWIAALYGADMGGYKVTYVAEPTEVQDAANKRYVDGRIWFGTQAQYDAIQPKLADVLYVVTSG